MTYQQNKFEEFVNLLERYSPQEGVNFTHIKGFYTFKAFTTHHRNPVIDHPALWITGQGEKFCYVGNNRYDFSVGKVLGMLCPMALDVEIVAASFEVPFLVAGIAIDLNRMADVLIRIDRINGATEPPAAIDPSSIFSAPLNDHLLDPFIRLLKLLATPRDAAMLGDSILDEIYYRLLCNERGGELRFLFGKKGAIQRISKAVEYIHRNLDKPISVEKLAEMVHMGQTTFYENFRNVMQLSPLQYAKSVKLDEAQRLIKQGKKANEAAYMVGYSSAAQFSREYKRHFGFTPSET